jgi:hypothetical protein
MAKNTKLFTDDQIDLFHAVVPESIASVSKTKRSALNKFAESAGVKKLALPKRDPGDAQSYVEVPYIEICRGLYIGWCIYDGCVLECQPAHYSLKLARGSIVLR